MSKIDESYHKLLQHILDNGFKYEDPNRKGIYRYQVPSYTIKHDFTNGFPAITTKKLYWKGVVGELLWFLRGDTNIKYLVDNNINIWNKDAYNYYKKNSHDPISDKIFLRIIKNNASKHYGDLGRIYGYQLRNFGGEFDQLTWLIDTLKNNPLATKKTVTFINPNDKQFQALSPCHTGFKVLIEPIRHEVRHEMYLKKYKLKSTECPWEVVFNTHKIPKYQFTLQWEQDSVDTFLGLPFNVTSYALLAQIIGKMTNMVPKGIIGDLSNVHIYEPHLDAVKEQLSRDINKYDKCNLKHLKTNDFYKSLSNNLSLLSHLDIKDFKLQEYESYPAIKAEMLAYNK